MEPTVSSITGILVTLKIGSTQSLFVVLHADGRIRRLGSGAADEPAEPLCSGVTSAAVFSDILAEITPELLAWCGQSLADPAPRGDLCELLLSFQHASGDEQTTAWEYGSDSFTPPLEIYDFVAAVVRLTDRWYEEQLDTHLS